MKIRRAHAILVGLMLCLATSAPATACSDASNTPETGHARIVQLRVKLSGSGVVRDVNVEDGAESLRQPAIAAVQHRKYRFVRKAAASRTVRLFVTFAENSNDVVDISQLALIIGGSVKDNTLANMKQVILAGSSGCVTPLGIIPHEPTEN